MSNANNIIERLTVLFNNVFEGALSLEGLSMDSRLVEDLGMNSIGLLYMAMAVEEEFGVKFTNEDFSKMRAVADVVAKIQGEG